MRTLNSPRLKNQTKKFHPQKYFFFLFIISLLLTPLVASSNISDGVIQKMNQELAELKDSKISSVRKRRAYKNIVQDGEKLIKASKDDTRRFEVLQIMLKAQQNLFIMKKSERNFKAIAETCEAISQAPDEYADIRFDAEFMLMEIEMNEQNADIKTRTKALEILVQSFKGTGGHLKSLIRGIQVAPTFEALELKNKWLVDLEENFPYDPQAILMRKKMGTSSLDVLFKGEFETVDGRTIKFPMDRLGQPYIVVFWSKDHPMLKERFTQLQEAQMATPGKLEVFSLNIDEIEDAGSSLLQDFKIESTVLRLPGGRKNEAFRAYSYEELYAIRVNPFGRVLISPSWKGKQDRAFHYPSFSQVEKLVTNQLQSHLIGEILLNDSWSRVKTDSESLPSELTVALRKLIPKPIQRYRLEKNDILSRYQKINELSENIIKKYPKANDLWRITHYKILSQMGFYQFKGDASFLLEAEKLSEELLSQKIPGRARVLPKYCMAKGQLRREQSKTKGVISDFVNSFGPNDDLDLIYAAATLLTLHTDSKPLFDVYRQKFLEHQDNQPIFDELVSFLKSRFHDIHLFQGSYHYAIFPTPNQRYKLQRYYIDNSLTANQGELPPFDYHLLEGGIGDFSKEKSENPTFLMFVEPPASGNITPITYSPPPEASKANPNPRPGGFIGKVETMMKAHQNQALNLITIFLMDDKERLLNIKKKYQWPGKIAYLKGGTQHRIVNQLGIYNSNKLPYSILLRRDNSVAWTGEDMVHPRLRYFDRVTGYAFDSNLARIEAEAGYRALESKDYQKALELFSAYPIQGIGSRHRHQHKWSPSLLLGRSLARVGLKDWKAALIDIDHAISEHIKYFDDDLNQPTPSMTKMIKTKAMILEQSGKETESKEEKAKVPLHHSKAKKVDPKKNFNQPYELFVQKLPLAIKEKI